jgi:hypothetical protein
VREHERQVLAAGGVVIRYGTFYGPGTYGGDRQQTIPAFMSRRRLARPWSSWTTQPGSWPRRSRRPEPRTAGQKTSARQGSRRALGKPKVKIAGNLLRPGEQSCSFLGGCSPGARMNVVVVEQP